MDALVSLIVFLIVIAIALAFLLAPFALVFFIVYLSAKCALAKRGSRSYHYDNDTLPALLGFVAVLIEIVIFVLVLTRVEF